MLLKYNAGHTTRRFLLKYNARGITRRVLLKYNAGGIYYVGVNSWWVALNVTDASVDIDIPLLNRLVPEGHGVQLIYTIQIVH